MLPQGLIGDGAAFLMRWNVVALGGDELLDIGSERGECRLRQRVGEHTEVLGKVGCGGGREVPRHGRGRHGEHT